MTLCSVICVSLILSVTIKIESARILGVFPIPSISHQKPLQALMHGLANRGHEVVVITTDPAFPKGGAPANLTEIDVHEFSYKIWVDYFIANGTGIKEDIRTQMRGFIEIFTIIFAKQLETTEIQELINNKKEKFDLIITEGLLRATIVFSYVFKAPVIQMNTFGNIHSTAHIVGNGNPTLYPYMSQKRIYNLTLLEKIRETYTHLRIQMDYDTNEDLENKLIRNVLGPDVPSVTDLQKNVQMVFLNTYHFWEDNRPVPPNVIYVGGILSKQKKGLPEDLKQFLDNSKAGVIYMSLGTNVFPSTLPPEIIRVFVKVLSQLPYDVLLKWDKDELPGATKNIKIGKWFPQFDVLSHPKVKLFIMQGGIQSTDEAITAGVPLIGIPFLADQWYNTEKYVHHGIGIQLLPETITEEKFMGAIQQIINNESYRQNVARIRSYILDQPQSSLERAVWWTEYVLRHGDAKHLRSPSIDMHWTEFYEVQLVLLCIALLLAIIFILIFSMHLAISYVNFYVNFNMRNNKRKIE